MKRITIGVTAVVVGTWVLGLILSPPAWNGRGVVHELFFVTGTVAYAWMALCMVIALRPAWLERVTKTPLDELYRHHRWLGYGAVILSVLHWITKFWAQIFTQFMDLAPAGRPVPVPADGMLEAVWQALRLPAVVSSEIFTAAMVVLGVLSAWKAFPYGKWLKTHKLFAWLFIGLALHSVRLMETADFYLPYGWVNLAVTAVGCWASVKLLLQGPGTQKESKGAVREVSTHGRVTKVVIDSPIGKDLAPGQFLFLKTGKESHPFSVAASTDTSVTFWIRELGDFTTGLAGKIRAGDVVKLEGPWGAFTPTLGEAPETWVAAGIGIAPFMSWLEEAVRTPHGPVTLFWCVRSREEEVLAPEVEALAKRAGVKIVIVESSKTGRLTPEQVGKESSGTVAVCGSEGLTQTLRTTLGTRSVRSEAFDWR